MKSLLPALLALSLFACSNEASDETNSPPTTGDEAALPDHAATERPQMSVEECEAEGTVVGDIGDGAVHRPDYRCPDGREPIGTVPSGIEGAVCCPK